MIAIHVKIKIVKELIMLFVKLYLPMNKHAKIESANVDFETDLTKIVEILVNFKNIYLTIKVLNNRNNE